MKYNTRARIGKAITEALEDRRLYSTVSMQDGVLTLALDSPGRVIVERMGEDSIFAFAGGKQQYLHLDELKAIKVVGSAGNDNVFINPTLKTPTEMHLGAGDDVVRGSGGDDIIYGDEGQDLIFARGGNNTVDAGDGDDVVWGGDGDDILYGGGGSDSIHAVGGKNTVEPSKSLPTLLATQTSQTPAQSDEGSVVFTPPTSTPVLTTPTTPTTPSTPVPSGSSDDSAQPPTTPAESAPSVNAEAPVVKIDLISNTMAAGQSVHAQGLDTVLKHGTILTAKFEWSFGDDSQQTLVGWNVAHTYANAGTYDLTLKVTDEAGNVSTQTQKITVTAANRTKIYVSADGNDKNDGLTEATAIKTAAKASTMIHDNTEVLFRRGDKFSMTEGIGIADKNVVIGAYGNGDRPILWKMEGSGRAAINIWVSSVDVTIRDITFDSPYVPINGVANKNATDGIHTGGTNITVSGCQFLNVTDAVNSDWKVTGLLVQNNVAPLADGLRAYLVWGQGTDHVYIGNTVANSTREHVVRMNGVERLLVADNNFSNENRQNIDGSDIAKGAIEVHEVKYAYVTGNTVHDGALRAGPRGGGVEDASTSTDYVVIEDNTVIGVSITLRPGAHHVMIRNNMINFEGNEAIKIFRADSQGRVSSDITIDHNTAVDHQATGQFLDLEGLATGITVTNNLFIAPNLQLGKSAAAPVYVGMNNLSAFRQISGNIWPDAQGLKLTNGGVNYIGASWGLSNAYQSVESWENYDVVQGDQFINVDEKSLDSLKIGPDTAGSTIRLAA